MDMLLLLAASIQAVVPPVELPPQADVEPCSFLTTLDDRPAAPFRMMSLEDQVSMTDIGRSSNGPAPNAFALSPDGSLVAIRVKRANPETNSYCLKLIVVPVDGRREGVEVDSGGDFIRDDFSLRNFTVTMAGWEKPNTPLWSPSGQDLAYLKRENDSTQVWLVDPTGKDPSRQITHLDDDVELFAWTGDDQALVVATRPGIRKKIENIGQEGRRGFLFDERFSPQFADRPLATGEIPYHYSRVSLADGSIHEAAPDEIGRLAPNLPTGVSPKARHYTRGPDGYSAWLEPQNSDYLLSATRLVISGPQGQQQICESELCQGIRGLWWEPDGTSLFLMQRTGWANSQTALLRWDRGEAAPQQVLLTDDVVTGCDPRRNELICAREGSLQPRRLVAIDMKSGRERIVHDPNPHFQDLKFGKVQRFLFTNSYGVESFADLVLPPHHRPGDKHPLVVVQYRSDGFLRGGTGDEVPIQPLAARGFAVLSFHRPDFLPDAMKATTEAEVRTLSGDPWADRKQVVSALEVAIQMAIDTGTVDPTKMGISGFSDGSSTASYAIQNTELFKVASLSFCCEDMYSYALAAGPSFTTLLRTMGYRILEPGSEDFWSEASLILNADKIDVPILVQSPDSEYEGGLDVIEALSRRGKAIELYVFPQETHVKWQPAHRLAIYERNIEWFAFWLKGAINCNPVRIDQYERWLAMPGAPVRSDLRCMGPKSVDP